MTQHVVTESLLTSAKILPENINLIKGGGEYSSITVEIRNTKMKSALKPLLTKNIYGNLLNQRNLANWKKEYSDHKITGYSMEQMFEVVSDVENYSKFLPFCRKSVVHTKSEKELLGELEVGFPPVIESYVSKVTLGRPYLVKADCTDGKLFHHLTTTWRFTKPHLRETKRFSNSCNVHFYVSFEFKSLLHSQLANIFFDRLVTEMEAAFFKEAYRRYGTPR